MATSATSPTPPPLAVPPSLDTLYGHHATGFAIATAVVIAAALFWPTHLAAATLPLLGAMVALVGVPHGALDHYAGRLLWGKGKGGWWNVGFFVGYGLFAAAIIACWLAVPGVTLGVFLLASVLHFGEGDALGSRWPDSEAAARGLMPVVLPTACYPNEVEQLFALLSHPAAAATLTTAIEPLLWPTLGLATLAIGRALWRVKTTGTRAAAASAVELLAVAALFCLVPPLVAFAVYFGLLHSLRHLMDSALAWTGHTGPAAWGFLLRTAFPITVLSLVLAAAAYPLLSEATFEGRWLQIIFIGLAAVTFPHMALITVAKRRGVL
ncbi:MAG: Brp/Blh family beta-carotene 15,15'-dioxygenase [Candidatus Competibacterales bacterium]